MSNITALIYWLFCLLPCSAGSAWGRLEFCPMLKPCVLYLQHKQNITVMSCWQTGASHCTWCQKHLSLYKSWEGIRPQRKHWWLHIVRTNRRHRPRQQRPQQPTLRGRPQLRRLQIVLHRVVVELHRVAAQSCCGHRASVFSASNSTGMVPATPHDTASQHKLVATSRTVGITGVVPREEVKF